LSPTQSPNKYSAKEKGQFGVALFVTSAGKITRFGVRNEVRKNNNLDILFCSEFDKIGINYE
jgi:hypothetical protein